MWDDDGDDEVAERVRVHHQIVNQRTGEENGFNLQQGRESGRIYGGSGGGRGGEGGVGQEGVLSRRMQRSTMNAGS